MFETGDRIEGLVDHYIVEGVQAEGGFGIAFRARRESDDQDVLLKQLRLDRVEQWKAVELFEREARVLAQLDHPNIPKYLELFAHTGERPVELTEDADYQTLVLVQERVQGDDLATQVKSGVRLDADEVESMLRELLGVLKYLHELNPPVVHRDINPRNIVMKGSTPYLVDFGAIQDRLRLETGLGSTNVGTFGYMPLEQGMGKAVGASDLYALGMTILFAVTHRNPSELPVVEETGKVRLEELAVDLSPSALRVLDGMIEPIVGQRISSAADALSLLDSGELTVTPDRSVARHSDYWRGIHSVLFSGALLVSGGVTVFIYGINFDYFTRRELISFAPLAVLPGAFGLTGHLVKRHVRRPTLTAIGGVIATGLALFLFLHVILPAL